MSQETASAASALPDSVRSLFSADAFQTARRFLQTGRVASRTFFRSGLAGDVVAQNGRTFAATLVQDRAGKLQAALCACSPALRAGRLCPHVAALVLDSFPPEAAGLGPADRFGSSLFFLLGQAFFEGGAGAEPRHETASGPDALRLETVARDGRPLVRAELPLAGPRAACLGDLVAPYLDGTLPIKPNAARVSKEQLLRRLSETPEEAAFKRAGVRTNQQAWEGSFWFRWAKAWFESFGEAWDWFRVEREDGRFVLTHRDAASGARLAAFPAPAAVERLLRDRDGEFFTRRGQTVRRGGLAPSFRVWLGKDEALRLTPVVLSSLGGGDEVYERDALEGSRFGEFYYLEAAGAFAALERPGHAFAEPEAPPQGTFSFDGRYLASPLGVPFDRETLVPRTQVTRFLSRHREELRRIHETLLAPALRSGLAASWSTGATVRVVGGEEATRGDQVVQLGLFYEVGGDLMPFLTLLEARRKGEPFVVHRDRLIDVADESLAWMDELPEDAVTGQGDDARLGVSTLQYLRLRSHLQGRVTLEGAADRLRLLEELRTSPPAPSCEVLGLRLYDFQEAGYRWLWFLHQNGFGGLLCDDMGLGKTHQAMALLRAVQLARPDPPPLFLVVCPTSLLPHWEEKLRRYLPSLPLTVHHGSGRGAAGAAAGAVLTSYGTLRNDAMLFAGRTFDVFVLDEIQTLKNRGTATYQALKTVAARTVIGLTGTPVENGVADVKSLLDFVLPGYLPGEATFRRRFVVPIEERGDAAARGRLQRLLHPFVLRRAKGQVLTELPEKIVDKRYCALSEEQAVLYREVVEGQAARLRERLEEERVIPYLHVFAVLSRLKQICNHPALVDPAARRDFTRPSGKWSLFTELLDECLSSGLKVVVFSQYVRMLDLFEAYLDHREVPFALLKGETVDRAGELRRFQTDPACRVFLASLRAGGLGVDLTAGSVVIHYDRWWNQAREEQATDRVHRMGQKRGVQVLKLITRGTLEERIDALIERKTSLAGDLVPEDDPHLAKQFTREELKGLLV